MNNKNRRAHITTGTLTLPVVAVLTALLWMLPDFLDWAAWGGLALTALATYLLLECSNRFTLLRVRSRMVSTTFLLLMMATPFLHSWGLEMLAMVSWMGIYPFLFATYQNARSQGCFFYALLFLGFGTLIFPPLILASVVMYLSLGVHLRALSFRTCFAGFLGLLLPYWLATGYFLATHQMDVAAAYIAQTFVFKAPNYTSLTAQQLCTFVAVCLMAVPGMFHYWQTAYDDKIRTRMFYYIIMANEALLIGLCLLQPQEMNLLLRLLLLNSAPIIAHHLTLGRGRWADIWMWCCLGLLLVLMLLNYLNLWTLL